MATAGLADQALVINGRSSLCKLVLCGDRRHCISRARYLMFHVDYAAAIRSPYVDKLNDTFEIGNGYTCKASFAVSMPRGNTVDLTVMINGDQAPLRRWHNMFVCMALVDNTKSLILSQNSWMRPYAALTVFQSYVESNCLKDGKLTALCSVFIVPRLMLPPPPDFLGHRLSIMSNDQRLTDVCFDVDGEMFNAHRLVMASQSEVFTAELFGSMAESNMNCCIHIQDMSTSTFKSMLHYIYCNQLPANFEDMDETTMIFELQHLLDAADRFRVDTLKKFCEDTLCTSISTDTVTSTLELAVARLFPNLRASCIEFLSVTKNFITVATTEEYCKLMQSYPDVLPEIRKRMSLRHAEQGQHLKRDIVK